ncbi:hypothetical protein ACJJTC_016839 [Scirpophaga incertulas]
MGLEDDISDIKSKLKELSLRRSSIKGQLTKFKNYLVTLESIQLSSIQVAELSLKVKKIELLSTTFDKIQNEVEIINHTNLEYELTERDIIESDIITCIAKANSFIEEASIHSEARRKSLVNETSCQHHVSENIGFKLPQIVISKFDVESSNFVNRRYRGDESRNPKTRKGKSSSGLWQPIFFYFFIPAEKITIRNEQLK